MLKKNLVPEEVEKIIPDNIIACWDLIEEMLENKPSKRKKKEWKEWKRT